VNESEKYRIRLSKNFEKTQTKLIRDRYPKNRKAVIEFTERINKLVTILRVDPRLNPPLGHLEPWPKNMNLAEWEFWKLEFKMPQLRGAAEKGRIIYLLNAALKEVVLIWIYTHAEYEKRPQDKDIKKRLLESIESIESGDFFEENNISETVLEDERQQKDGELEE
jgi:hypothetical protein